MVSVLRLSGPGSAVGATHLGRRAGSGDTGVLAQSRAETHGGQSRPHRPQPAGVPSGVATAPAPSLYSRVTLLFKQRTPTRETRSLGLPSVTHTLMCPGAQGRNFRTRGTEEGAALRTELKRAAGEGTGKGG